MADEVKVKTSNNEQEDYMDARIDWILRTKVPCLDRDSDARSEASALLSQLQTLTAETTNQGRQLVSLAVVLVLTFVFSISIGFMAVSQDVHVGRLEAAHPGEFGRPVVLTTQEHSQQSMMNMLSFDMMTNEWVVSDSALRELDTVAFELTNGSFYHFEVVEVVRQDSGADGETDKLEIATSSGTHLRLWEALGSLEARWPGSSMWENVDINDDPRELLDVDQNGAPTEVDPPESGRSLRPPGRLLAKGAGGVGAGTGMGRGGVGGVGGVGMGGRTAIYSGVIVGSMYHHRVYRGDSQRQCYSDETFRDGRCRPNSAPGRAPFLFATVAAAFGMLSFLA